MEVALVTEGDSTRIVIDNKSYFPDDIVLNAKVKELLKEFHGRIDKAINEKDPYNKESRMSWPEIYGRLGKIIKGESPY